MKHGMSAELIPNDSFLHTAHNTGLCRIVETRNTQARVGSVSDEGTLVCPLAADSDIIKAIAISTFDCISLLKITKLL